LPIANDIVLDAVTNLYRKDGTNFRLLSSSDSERSAIESMMIECLAAIRRAGCARPYSLTSKYWHFLLPEAFPIYDKQVASAIETWSRAAFDCQSPDGFRMSVRFRQGRTTDTSGSGYRGVLDFYHLMWEGSSADLRAEAHEVASALEGDVRRRYGTELARITVLDLIDKYLWRAFAPNGRCGQRVVVWTDVDQGSRTAEAG